MADEPYETLEKERAQSTNQAAPQQQGRDIYPNDPLAQEEQHRTHRRGATGQSEGELTRGRDREGAQAQGQHPHGGPPGQTGDHPQGGPPGHQQPEAEPKPADEQRQRVAPPGAPPKR